jgi:hypothetical protein
MIKTVAQCRASHPAHDHSPQGMAACHAWPAGRLAGPEPVCHRGIARARHARDAITERGHAVMAQCPLAARWQKWKATTEVSTEVARRGLAGLTEDGSQR